MNNRMSRHERTKSWPERTKVGTWTHDILDQTINAGGGDVMHSDLHSLETSKNAWKSEHERTKICWMNKSLDLYARNCAERTKVWTWTHESLDMGTFRLTRSRYRLFLLVAVCTKKTNFYWYRNLWKHCFCSNFNRHWQWFWGTRCGY